MFRKFDNIYIYTNEDANFVSYAKENKTQELLDLFNKNILYKKENGKIITQGIEYDFIKEIKRNSNIFYDKQNMPLIPETCELTY
jgi:hypothetical protein